MANLNDITAYRKKKKRKSLVYKAAAIGLLMLGFAVIWINAETIFEPVRGIASRINNTTSSSEGFPVRLPGSAKYSFSAFGGNFLLLTDTYLYTYAASGKQIYALQHEYSDPVQLASDRRILLYDHNSYEFSLYSKTSKIYEEKLDDKIVSGALGGDDRVAVVTSSQLYANVLRVYSGSGKNEFTRKFVDEDVNSVAFTGEDKRVVVGVSTVENGEITSWVYKLRTDSEDDVVWKYGLPAGSWVLKVSESGGVVYALCDNLFAAISLDTGTLLGSYSFGTGTLVYPVIGSGLSLMLFSDYKTGVTTLVSFDKNAGVIASRAMPITLNRLVIQGDAVYTLTGRELAAYDRFLNPVQTVLLDEEYEDFIIMDKEAFLLAYERVDRKSLVEEGSA